MKNLVGLVGWLLASLVTAAIGAAASVQASEFYNQLQLPSWAPPAWVFGPVWSLLYLSMALAAWLVWRQPPNKHRYLALVVYIGHLPINAVWSWVFFVWHAGLAATVNITVLVIVVVIVIILFLRERRLAGLLLLPYLAWVCFAGFLCAAIWQANPGAL